MPWNDGLSGEPIHNQIKNMDAKLVHLHWIASGFPAIKYLPKIKEPVVWTFHDVWSVTAGHHCDMNCKACKIDGKNCAEFDYSPSAFPSSEYLWQYKKKFYNKIKKLTIITPSRWLADMVKQSPLFHGRKVVAIPNCVNTDLFRPLDKSAVRKILNLPLDKKIIMFSGDINVWYKGYDLLVEALWSLKKKIKLEDIHLIVLGSPDGGNLPLPYPATFFAHIDLESMLPIIYNAADVFVGPSRQDNFPNVFVESLSCGVPGVGFDVGGIPEIVAHKKHGFIAKSFDTDEFAQGISWVISDSMLHKNLGNNSRKFAQENFSYSKVAESHRQLYEEILLENKKLLNDK